MSKAIRIKDHLYAEIERLAKTERRSLIGQLELLLEQALAMETRITETRHTASGTITTERTLADAQPRDVPARSVTADPHFKPDFK